MFAMFRQLFDALASFCSALGYVGKAAENITKIGEEMSATYLDETRVQRKAKLAALNKEHGTDVTVTG